MQMTNLHFALPITDVPNRVHWAIGSKHMMIEIYVDKSSCCTYIDCNMMTEELIHNIIEEYSDVSTVFERPNLIFAQPLSTYLLPRDRRVAVKSSFSLSLFYYTYVYLDWWSGFPFSNCLVFSLIFSHLERELLREIPVALLL